MTSPKLETYFMKEALKQAKLAYKNDEVPIGAIIVNSKTDEIIAKAYNKTIKLNDPTAHAEILAIRKACKKIGNYRITNCDLYVTLEPCNMCASAISWARINKLCYATKDEKFGAIDSTTQFFSQKNQNYKPKISSGLLGQESARLLKDFFHTKRKK